MLQFGKARGSEVLLKHRTHESKRSSLRYGRALFFQIGENAVEVPREVLGGRRKAPGDDEGKRKDEGGDTAVPG